MPNTDEENAPQWEAAGSGTYPSYGESEITDEHTVLQGEAGLNQLYPSTGQAYPRGNGG